MRIPMAVKYPNIIAPGQVSEKLVSNIDIGPTILDLAGTAFEHSIDGRSLMPMLKDQDAEWEDDLMCETMGHFSAHLGRMIITERYKYIYNERDSDELYDLKEDPFEMKNLIRDEKYSEILTDLKSRLKKWRKRTKDTTTIRDVRKDRIRFVKENANMSTLLNLDP